MFFIPSFPGDVEFFDVFIWDNMSAVEGYSGAKSLLLETNFETDS